MQKAITAIISQKTAILGCRNCFTVSGVGQWYLTMQAAFMTIYIRAGSGMNTRVSRAVISRPANQSLLPWNAYLPISNLQGVACLIRIGQLFKALPKADKGNQYTGKMVSNTSVTNQTTKQETIEDLGFNKMQASRLETLAEHPEIVEQVKDEAIEKDYSSFETATAILVQPAAMANIFKSRSDWPAFI